MHVGGVKAVRWGVLIAKVPVWSTRRRRRRIWREIRAGGERSNQSGAHAAFEKFVTTETLSTVVGLIADFYVSANGYDEYRPFGVKPALLFEGNCSQEVVHSLEQTQLNVDVVQHTQLHSTEERGFLVTLRMPEARDDLIRLCSCCA